MSDQMSTYKEDIFFIALAGAEINISLISLIIGMSGVFISSTLPAIVSAWTLYKPSIGTTQLNTIIHSLTPLILGSFLFRDIQRLTIFKLETSSLIYILSAIISWMMAYCSFECTRKIKRGFPLLWQFNVIPSLDKSMKNVVQTGINLADDNNFDCTMDLPDSLFNSENSSYHNSRNNDISPKNPYSSKKPFHSDIELKIDSMQSPASLKSTYEDNNYNKTKRNTPSFSPHYYKSFTPRNREFTKYHYSLEDMNQLQTPYKDQFQSEVRGTDSKNFENFRIEHELSSKKHLNYQQMI